MVWDEICCFACRLAAGDVNIYPGAGRSKMLETIIVILVIMWLLGFGLHIGGSLIHLLLVIAVIVVIVRVIRGRPAV